MVLATINNISSKHNLSILSCLAKTKTEGRADTMTQAVINFSLVMILAVILLYHCYKIRGSMDAIVLTIVAGGVGAIVEFVGVTSGGYEYTGQNLLMVTFFTGVGWIANTYLAIHLSTFILGYYQKLERLNLFDVLKIAFFASILGITYDLFTDPVATALKVWVWSYEGPWYGVPTPNFIGWFFMLLFNIIGIHMALTYGKTVKQKIVIAIISALIFSFLIITILKVCAFLNIQ